MQNDEKENPHSGLARPKIVSTRPRPRSIARRLFLSAALLSFAILLVAGLVLSTIYRRTAEANFDERLGVYLHELIADIATSAEDSRVALGQLGEPQFELPLSGWYWQVTRLDVPKPEINTSRSLFAAKLPRLSDAGVAAGAGGARRGYAKGPDDRVLRMAERIIDMGDQGIYLVQVAATTEEIDAQISRFEFDLMITFAALAIALVVSSAAQLRYGLKPLRQLQEGVSAIRRGEAEKIGGDFPQDLAPLASELNLLIGANRDVVERARTQVGNLAHALKTPLSVIINEAAADRGPLAAKVEEQAAIMRDQVSYYLNRARAAVRARTLGGVTEVAPSAEALVRTFEKIYSERAIGFTLMAPRTLRFPGERQDFEEMVGNLVDNAGKWARHAVTITMEPEPCRTLSERRFFRVMIDDDGPGLAPDLRQAALSRGQRLDETKPGSGLGLSIVADLAGLYGGALTLEDGPGGGLRANLRLPSA
ncbi:MAG TPA: ATP-binding protein [Methylocella sp.]|nr:ATP-binding protein [Methylocella sp.]